MEKFLDFKFDIQMFANPNTNVTTDAALSDGMKVYYDTDLLENARPQLIFGQFSTKQALPKNGGNQVEWRRFDTFPKAMKPLTEGVTPDGRKLSQYSIHQKIDQYGDYVTLSDRLQFEHVDPVIQVAVEEEAAQAGQTKDALTRNEILTGTNVAYANGKTARHELTADDKVTAKDVAKWNTFLKKMLAPKIGNDYVAIIHPSVAEDLRNDDAWIEAHKYAQPNEIYNGEIGKLHNIRFVEDTEQKVWRGADLSEKSRELALSANATSTDKVSIATGSVVADELVGRLVLIGDGKYEVIANTDTQLTLVDPITGDPAKVSATSGTVIYPGEGGKAGCAVYAVTVIGKGAYGEIEPSAESMQVIVKQLGAGDDPLNQRSSVGFKFSHAAKILYEERILRFECGSSYSDIDEDN